MGEACDTRGRDEKYGHNTRKFKLCLVQVNLVLFLQDSRRYLRHLLLDFPDGLYSSGFYPKKWSTLFWVFFFRLCYISSPSHNFFITLILD
jgi:hypothetical protein